MRSAWLGVIIVGLGVGLGVACKKDPAKPGDSVAAAAAPAPPLVADIAAVDALWALAPPGATIGGVITGRALTLVERAATAAADSLSRLPSTPDHALVGLRHSFLGTATGLAEAGLALERGAAFFTDGRHTVFVLPVADRGKFRAAHFGTTDGHVDEVRGVTCKPILAFYACADDPSYLALGGGDLGKRAGVQGVRGDGELVAELPGLPPGSPLAPTGPVTMALNIRAGEMVVRGRLPAKLTGLLAGLAAQPRAVLDIDTAAGVLILPLGLVAKLVPDRPIVPGVTTRALFDSFAGPLQAVVPTGASDVDVRIPLRDPAPAAAILARCGELGGPLPVAAIPDGGCRIGPLPGVDFSAAVWVEASALRASAARGPAPRPLATSPPSAAGRELAGYTAAFWGHGLFGGGPTADLPPQVLAMMSAFSVLTELGMGADFTPDGISFLLVARTIHTNPYALTARLDAALASDDAATVATLARANPGTPLASDHAAGPFGLAVPTLAIGVVAAVAIPAFLEYMARGKGSEADLGLQRIVKSAQAYRLRTGGFPVGKAGPTPATSCCDGPDRKCAPDPAAWAADPVWAAIDFSVDEPHRFQFRYDGTATGFTAIAEADLDCDRAGTTVVTARGSLDAQGNPTAVFSKSGVD